MFHKKKEVKMLLLFRGEKTRQVEKIFLYNTDFKTLENFKDENALINFLAENHFSYLEDLSNEIDSKTKKQIEGMEKVKISKELQNLEIDEIIRRIKELAY